MKLSSLLPGLAFLATLALAPPEARATSMVRLTATQLTDASDYIVHGVVSSVWVAQEADGLVWTHVDVEISETLKGPAGLDTLRVDVPGGILTDRSWIVDGVPRFAEAEEVLIFAEVMESGRIEPVGLVQGKYTVRVDPHDGRKMLVSFNPPMERAYDPRFLPDPPHGQRLYLDDLQRVVTDRVRAGWDGQPIPGKSTERLRVMHGRPVEVTR